MPPDTESNRGLSCEGSPAQDIHAIVDAVIPSRPFGGAFLAVAGTAVFTGVGHLLIGRRRRGVCWMAATLLVCGIGLASLLSSQTALFGFGILAFLGLLQLCAFVDAILCGRRCAVNRLGGARNRYLLATAILAAVIFSPVTPATLAAESLRPWLNSRGTYLATVASASMSPWLQAGDRLIAHSTATYERGDVVLFRITAEEVRLGRGFDLHVKRIAGLPGETIAFRNGELLVNGSVAYAGSPPIYDPRTLPPYRLYSSDSEWKLEADEYFMIGDNSAVSLDSRNLVHPIDGHQPGAVPASRICGKVTAVYWPPKRAKDWTK